MAEKLESFNDIAGNLADVQAAGEQIIAEQAATPFGAELLRTTDETYLQLGDMACVHSLNTKVDDSTVEAELYTGFEPVAEAATNSQQIHSLI